MVTRGANDREDTEFFIGCRFYHGCLARRLVFAQGLTGEVGFFFVQVFGLIIMEVKGEEFVYWNLWRGEKILEDLC